jgi:2-polyprenyl-3-methyl-5-hydroxy-6-metoxy-1,4-benzoquinol methylase
MINNPNATLNSDASYYQRIRTWPSLFKLKSDAKVLDIGCGSGQLGQYFQNELQCAVTGVEITEHNYAIAKTVLSNTLLGDIESLDLHLIGADFDYIIFSDSLEHMLNPDKVLIRVQQLIATNGELLISIPNVRNFRVTVPLVFKGDWEYQDEGLLDRTHLRFFTIASISRLLYECGYKVEEVLLDLPTSSKVGVLNMLTFGLFSNHLTSHYFIRARKCE